MRRLLLLWRRRLLRRRRLRLQELRWRQRMLCHRHWVHLVATRRGRGRVGDASGARSARAPTARPGGELMFALVARHGARVERASVPEEMKRLKRGGTT